MGIPDEAFLWIVEGEWERIAHLQISWLEPQALLRGVLQIYEHKTTNAKKDAAQNEIQYAQSDGKSVRFLANHFLYADARTMTEVDAISTCFRTMSNEF